MTLSTPNILITYYLGDEHAVIVQKADYRAMVVQAHIKFIPVRFQFLYLCQFIFRRCAGVIVRLAEHDFFNVRQKIIDKRIDLCLAHGPTPRYKDDCKIPPK